MKRTYLAISGAMWILSAIGGFLVGFYLAPGSAAADGAFAWLSTTMLPMCFLFALATPRFPWRCPLAAIFALAIGIGVDAMTDKTMDRNLWGIEAIIFQIMALPATIMGGATGTLLSRVIWRRKSARPADPGHPPQDAGSPAP